MDDAGWLRVAYALFRMDGRHDYRFLTALKSVAGEVGMYVLIPRFAPGRTSISRFEG